MPSHFAFFRFEYKLDFYLDEIKCFFLLEYELEFILMTEKEQEEPLTVDEYFFFNHLFFAEGTVLWRENTRFQSGAL